MVWSPIRLVGNKRNLNAILDGEDSTYELQEDGNKQEWEADEDEEDAIMVETIVEARVAEERVDEVQHEREAMDMDLGDKPQSLERNKGQRSGEEEGDVNEGLQEDIEVNMEGGRNKGNMEET